MLRQPLLGRVGLLVEALERGKHHVGETFRAVADSSAVTILLQSA